MRLPVTGVFAAALLLAGCAESTAGHPVAAPSHAARPLAGGDLDNVLLSASQLGRIVGAKLQPHADESQPVPTDPAEGPCAALDAAGMRSFVGDGYAGFRLLLLSDGSVAEHDHVVAEAAAIYPDVATAARAFAAAVAGLRGCNGQQVKEEAAWRFAVDDTTPDTVRWNKEQMDLPMLWRCYGQSRVRVNVIAQAMACQGDDGGDGNADAILNRMSAAIWDLSAG